MMLAQRSASDCCLATSRGSTAVPRLSVHRNTCGRASAACRATQQEAIELQEARAAFNASLERIVNATSSVAGKPGGAECSVEESSTEIGRLALLHSTHRRFSRTHMNTVNMSLEEDDDPTNLFQQLPLSQLAFKSLLRASLAAARLNHSYLTTPHILLGLLSAAATCTADSTTPSSSSSSTFSGPACLAPVAGRYAEAEAAVCVMIDGPKGSPVSAAAAAASLLGQSGGLDVVTWCGQLSSRAQDVLAAAEHSRQQQGHPLLTSSHLLAALLQESAAAPQPWVNSLLEQLGLQPAQVALQLQQQLGGGAASAAAADSEDSVLCEPVGILHEEFYNSLLRVLSPAAPAAHSLN